MFTGVYECLQVFTNLHKSFTNKKTKSEVSYDASEA